MVNHQIIHRSKFLAASKTFYHRLWYYRDCLKENTGCDFVYGFFLRADNFLTFDFIFLKLKVKIQFPLELIWQDVYSGHL